MSWSIKIIMEKPIDEGDLTAVLNAMPPELQGPGGLPIAPQRQSWGWSMAVDVTLAAGGGCIQLSGSASVSGGLAGAFRSELMRILNRCGHPTSLFRSES
jgi:hypothetical protein